MDYHMDKTAHPLKKSLKKPAPKAMSMEEALAELIRRNEELTSLNKSKDEFIAITSHQLRTPATGVKQYLGLLLEGYAEPLTENQRVFLEKAYENNERQLHIVDDILRIAQLDLDKIKLRLLPTDLNILAEKAITSLESKFHLHSQSVKLIKTDGPLIAIIDPEQMRMAIENILENASNYSADGKRVTVRITKLADNKARISIKDQGVGINARDISKLFQKFSRVNNPLSNNVNGTGLGLYFSKKIIELHDAKIDVRSATGKGATFSITISIQKSRNFT
jgi:two-component system phosphate regulon sensor histidine kinase PhoR